MAGEILKKVLSKLSLIVAWLMGNDKINDSRAGKIIRRRCVFYIQRDCQCV